MGSVLDLTGPDGARLLRLTDLIDLVRPQPAVPVHHADYGVFRSPVEDFVREATTRGHGERLRVVRPGETVPLA